MSLRKTLSAEERPLSPLPPTDSTASGQSIPTTASTSSSGFQSPFAKEEIQFVELPAGSQPQSLPPGLQPQALQPTASVVSQLGCRTDSAYSTSQWEVGVPAYLSLTSSVDSCREGLSPSSAKMRINIRLWQPDDPEHRSPLVEVYVDESARVSQLLEEVNLALHHSERHDSQVTFFRRDGKDDQLPMQESLSVLQIGDGDAVFASLKPMAMAQWEPAKIPVTLKREQDKISPHIGTSKAQGSSGVPYGFGGYQPGDMNLGDLGNAFTNPHDWRYWNAAHLQMLPGWQHPITAYPFMYGRPPVQNESFAGLDSPIQEVPLEGIDVEPFLVPITWAGDRPDGVHHVVHKSEKGMWHHYIFWVIDGKKLDTTDKQLLSPQIMLPLGAEGAGEPFVLMIHPKISYLSKGGGSFKKAKGKASISIKCMSFHTLREDDAKLKFRVMVGSRDPLKQQSARGPIDHNFVQNSTAQLPKDSEQWNLVAAVDESTKKFIVALEVQNLKLDGGRDEV